MSERWDETWHRLREWTNGQAPSERLAALVLDAEGFTGIDPSHPLGGPDGGKDAIGTRDGVRWVIAVYFPRGQQPFAKVKRKLVADAARVARSSAEGIVFVTNQEVRLGERGELAASLDVPFELFHLERLVHVLDRPRMADVRRRFLGIGHLVRAAPPDVRPVSVIDDGLFVARERELHELCAFLGAGEGRSVYVVSGLAGGGKTALAHRAVAEVVTRGHFGGGYVVDMRGYDLDVDSAVRGSDVYAGALRSLGAEPAADEAQLPAQYHALLDERDAAGQPVVILLDNVHSTSQITMLLPRSRRHRVVVTSRSDLAPLLPNAAGAALAPLPEPDAARVIEAVCSAAGRALPEADSTALTTLSKLCGHLPLALRVAAAILVLDRSLSPNDLNAELADETHRLDTLQYEDTAVRAVLRASYVRLGASEAQCFRYLSAHPGPEFATGAAAAVLDTTEADARRLLRRLATCHLLEADSLLGWRMHDLIRLCSVELAAEHDPPGKRRTAQLRVVGYYANAVSDASAWFNANAAESMFGTRASALDWLRTNGANAVAAAHLAEANREHEATWRLGMNLLPYLSVRHDFATALSLLEAARSSAAVLRDPAGEAGALNNIGTTLTSLGRLAEAAERFRQGLAVARHGGCDEEEASLLVQFASLRRRQAGPRGGVLLLDQAAAIRRRIGDRRGLAFVLTNQAISFREAGAFDAAITVLREALVIHRENGARHAEASTLTHLATALAQANRYEESLPYFAEAVQAAADVRDMSGVASTCLNLALTHWSRGKPRDAVGTLERALAALDETDDVAVRWGIEAALALVCHELGDEEAARRHKDLAAALRSRLGGPGVSLDYLPGDASRFFAGT